MNAAVKVCCVDLAVRRRRSVPAEATPDRLRGKRSRLGGIASLASAGFPAFSPTVDGLPKTVDVLPKTVDRFARTVDVLPKTVDGFARMVDAFAKTVDRFARTVDAFPKKVDRFARTVDAFPKKVDRFAETVDVFARPVDPFCGKLARFSASAGRISPANLLFSAKSLPISEMDRPFFQNITDFPRHRACLPHRGPPFVLLA